MKLKEARLVRLADDSLCLIPLEEFKNGFFDRKNCDKICDFIQIDPPKINLWVYKENRGFDVIGNEDHLVSIPTEVEIKNIFKNGGICFIQTDDNNELSSPSNPRGERAVIIHLSKETEEIPSSS